MGAEAKEAVSKIVKLYEKEKGQTPYEALTLAAIGPAASEAIPALTRYVTPASRPTTPCSASVARPVTWRR